MSLPLCHTALAQPSHVHELQLMPAWSSVALPPPFSPPAPNPRRGPRPRLPWLPPAAAVSPQLGPKLGLWFSLRLQSGAGLLLLPESPQWLQLSGLRPQAGAGLLVAE